ncbi:uncharacterized protein LOC113494058 [Trichoplusia ni]|uniref:Uncharacterized protein LOC113494058 n=1 Tax=Trichoplusia ni TaxID=7111 RepID=A0A7E5VIC2_TRINI|nr:uncharacterized protein LOC113494058 [Trichoplusia ni]
MTNTVSLVVAFSLLINEVHVLFDSSILQNKFFTSNLVYLLSVCLIIRKFNLLPQVLWKKSAAVCYMLEIPISMIILEVFLFYLWKHVQDYLLFNADGILVHLAEERGLEWLVCHYCCGQSNCTAIFADIALKFLSFAMLLVVCFFVKSK